MKGYIHDISDKARENTYFRQVLETGKHTQIVVMSIPEGGEIGTEVHPDTDQVLYFVSGEGKDDVVLVNAGTRHNFINTGTSDLKIITAYSPPHHPPATIHKTKAEAD